MNFKLLESVIKLHFESVQEKLMEKSELIRRLIKILKN